MPRDYPTEEELQQIEKWPHTDFPGLMSFARSIWEYDCWKEGTNAEGKTVYRLATAGWSGNESIISALCANHMFWAMCWQLSARGGLHVFICP
jgi:hypothetical protein